MRNVFILIKTILNSDTCIPKRTALKLEMQQNVWQSSQKLSLSVKI